ncbi:hypothetical protein PR048_005630 [Dryococelus australis]|uniref:Uncharacterized protein n=1 Tax=Dryococelus australis TaxID=614101 RepID=A0ABQ9I9S9_9NEOP|nr:hypothetical protein PR048_005630 [Dryococelus australis]
MEKLYELASHKKKCFPRRAGTDRGTAAFMLLYWPPVVQDRLIHYIYQGRYPAENAVSMSYYAREIVEENLCLENVFMQACLIYPLSKHLPQYIQNAEVTAEIDMTQAFVALHEKFEMHGDHKKRTQDRSNCCEGNYLNEGAADVLFRTP